MKEQHANSGQVFYADYVVPVYNLNKDARYLTTYSNENMSVDLWAVRATPGKEMESMQNSMQRACQKADDDVLNAPYNEALRIKRMELQSLRELLINPKYYQVIDATLRAIIAADLKKRGLKTNLEQAKYLFGFSFYACFKEVLR
ncbi:MAG: hypothetical protein ACI4NZ_03090 [Candidatus Enterousia sp.]